MKNLCILTFLLLYFGESLQLDVNTLPFTIDPEEHFLLSRKTYRTCPSLRWTLSNGWVKMRSNGRIARFSCASGYDLIGDRYSTCIRGRWDRQIPVCASGTCSKLPLDARRQELYSHENKVLDVHCDLGYYLKLELNNSTLSEQFAETDPPSKLRLYCVSGVWNIESLNNFRQDRRWMIPLTIDTEYPKCEIFDHKSSDSQKCNYEESLCNWFQDNSDDFDWTRSQFSTPSHLDRTGPSFDHTKGANDSGWYLYLESSYPRVPGEKARLFSPVFHQNLTGVRNGCFRFYYHMYGSAIGSLRVFVMERTQVLQELTPRAELVGEQGEEWKLAEIDLQPCENCSELNPFQIIFEGEIGHGHQGDIAIDDVHLQLGQSCLGVNSTKIDVDPDLRIDMQREKLNITQDDSNSTTVASTISTAENSTSITLRSENNSLTPQTSIPSSVDNFGSKNTTFNFRIPLINHIKSYFKPKNTTTTTPASPKLALTTSTTTTSTATPSTSTTTTSTPPTTTSLSTTNDQTFDHLKWLAKLHEKLNANKNRTKTKSSTTPSQTIESTTVLPLNITPPNTSDNVSVINASTLRVESLQISQSKPSSASWLIVLCSVSLLALVVILLSLVAISYDSSLNPLKFGTRNVLGEFVSASFVRRAGRSSTNASGGDDDGELLVMEDSSAGCSNEYVDDDQHAIYPTDVGNSQSCLVYLRPNNA